VHAAHLAEVVRAHQADLGIARDGDADRVVIADGSGRVYNGDELLYVIVRDRLAVNGVRGVVGTLMTNYALERRLGELGVPFERAKVGDRYVLELLEQRGWLLGGEGSGHILCLDKHTTGDGIISSLQVLAAMRRARQTLAQLTADLPLLPQSLVNVRIGNGFDWKQHAPLAAEVDAVEKRIAGHGRVLIRASGTEPVLRLMVEADDVALASALAQRLADAVGRP
jgi:phosphoglucosamine mutase